MALLENEKNSCFSQHKHLLSIKGSKWLTYRDVPELVKKFVSGTATLDYGCGVGDSAILLKSLGLNVDGVDINENNVAGARQVDPSGKYAVIESGKIPAPNKYYDFIFCGWVFEYIKDKSEIRKIIQDISRCVKVGGIFMTIVGNQNTFTKQMYSAINSTENQRNLYSGAIMKVTVRQEPHLTALVYYWTEKDYNELITNAGFEVICIHTPIGKDSDGYEWISEKDHPVCAIFVAKKLADPTL